MDARVSLMAVQPLEAAQLVANLCCALRSPTASASGQIAALIAKAAAVGLSAAAADLERIRTACARLQALVDQLAEAPRLAYEEPEHWLATQAHWRHDLRTPLNAVKGYGDMLLDDWREDGQDALVADLRRVLTTADELLMLIDASPSGV